MTKFTLQTHKELSSDIYPRAFDWVFVNDVFVRWRDTKTAWQIHLVGGPGAGKTTLASLVARHLRAHEISKPYPIVSFYVDQEVHDHDINFLEDFLETLYYDLGKVPRLLRDDESDDLFEQYRELRFDAPEGSRLRQRLKTLRAAVDSRLQSLQQARAYLLLDGIDQCEPTLRMMMEELLSELQNAGLSVLLTSRLAVFEQVEARCDHRNHDDAPDDASIHLEDREVLDLFQVCRTCGDVLCYSCAKANRVCGNCGDNDSLFEPYDHVNIRLSVPGSAMREYISWDLEREHGDLGLGSKIVKPPLSPLGKSLRTDGASQILQQQIENVLEFSYGHFGLAKARLDLIHQMESLDGLNSKRDQLPPTIIAIFDRALERIESLRPETRALALAAFASASSSDEGAGIPFVLNNLRQLGTAPDIRSGEEIVEATRGFLMTTIQLATQHLTVFNQNFLYYVEQRYNRAIHRASLQLETPKARFEPQNLANQPGVVTPFRLSRATTAMQTIEESQPQQFIIRKGTRAWA